MTGHSRYQPLISVIVPTYNEEADIELTLEALANLNYPHKEILVVDDGSRDKTPAIIAEYERRYPFVKMIQQQVNQGVARARNIGIQYCRGDIVVILNADVLLPPDFLDRILRHYEAGFDYVLVESEVLNQQYLFPRYLQALHRYNYGGNDSIDWTEGFSCRRQAAIDAGLFPESIPGCSGEDAVFAEALARRGRKVFDRSIVVSHVAPHTLGGFWHQQKGRGRGAPYVQHCVMSRSLAFLATKILIKSFYRPLKSLIGFPWFFVFYCCSRQKVHYGYRDFFPFVLAKTVETIAHRVGEWKGLCEIAYGRVGR